MQKIPKGLNEEIEILQASCHHVPSIYLKNCIKVMTKECLQNDKELHPVERHHAQISVHKNEF
jgi:hypothetical protein